MYPFKLSESFSKITFEETQSPFVLPTLVVFALGTRLSESGVHCVVFLFPILVLLKENPR